MLTTFELLLAVENIASLAGDIGYYPPSNSRRKGMLDVTNSTLFEMAKNISNIPDVVLDLGEKTIKTRAIVTIAQIYSRIRTNDPLTLEVAIVQIANLTSLNIDLHTKEQCFNELIILIKKIATNEKTFDFRLFSTMQRVWSNILSERVIAENKYASILRILRSLIEITVKYPRLKKDSNKVSPMLYNMNRIFVDLAYYLVVIYRSSKENVVKNNCENLFQKIIEMMLYMDEMILSNDPSINIGNLIVSPCVVGFMGVSSNLLTVEGLLNIVQSKSFHTQVLFGINIIYKRRSNKYLLNLQKLANVLSSNLEKIETTFTNKKFDRTSLDQIETRPGEWFQGMEIGQLILMTINILLERPLAIDIIQNIRKSLIQ